MKVLGNNYVLYYTSGLRTKTSSKYNLPNNVKVLSLGKEEGVNKRIEYYDSDESVVKREFYHDNTLIRVQ